MRKHLLILAILTPYFFYSQENKNETDSLKTQHLNEVVVTGQLNPQSVRKSVFEVKVLTRDDIDRQAGNNLADLLNHTLNISILPNASTGKSGVQLFGLDAQYFKILVDNIPLINDEGLGNNADLTQINLDDVERIEIVEGAMGVQYGANAVSGIINIITKKSAEHRWEIVPFIQEETVGSEYNLSDRGRHIQSLKVGHTISDKWYAQAVYNRNDFKGFYNDRKGKNHAENDGLRGHEWLPKTQNTFRTLLNYRDTDFGFFYKFEFFDETVSRFDPAVRLNVNPATQTSNPTASDEIFTSQRIYNHVNVFGKIKQQMRYNVSISFQEQKRDIETYTYRILQRQKENTARSTFESRRAYFSRGTLSNFISGEKYTLQLGYELQQVEGFASPLSGFYETPISRTLGSYDFFTEAEIIATEKLSLRPGVRAMFSPQFQPLFAMSLSTRYLLPKNWEARAIVGSAPRTPSYDELYAYFVDVNHDLRGNENLQPEQGASAFLHLKKPFWFNDYTTRYDFKFSGWYLHVRDRIELTIVNTSPLAYQYNNIDRFQSWGLSTTHSLEIKNLQLGLGASFTGVSKVLDSREDYNDDFLYALQANANLAYQIPEHKLRFALYYKYNGPQYLFVQRQNEANETVLIRGKQDGFSWMDASVQKRFWENRFELTLGARNLLNVNRINTTATEGGAHSAAPNSLMLGYGRSYFLKLLYNLNF